VSDTWVATPVGSRLAYVIIDYVHAVIKMLTKLFASQQGAIWSETCLIPRSDRVFHTMLFAALVVGRIALRRINCSNKRVFSQEEQVVLALENVP